MSGKQNDESFLWKDDEIKVGMITKRSQQMKSFSPTNFKERVFVLTKSKITYYEGSIEVCKFQISFVMFIRFDNPGMG